MDERSNVDAAAEEHASLEEELLDEQGIDADADPEDTGASSLSDDDLPGHIDAVAAPEEELDTEAELEQLRDRHLRLAAEFDNFRRRTRRELTEAGEIARADLAGRLLEVMDDLQRVADQPCDETTSEALHQGTEMVARKLTKTLTDAGMEQVNPVGERFDPNLHEALMMQPTDDPEQDEIVASVVLVGYQLGERLLRPARVTVYRHEEESA